MERSARIPTLDGWRAIAIISVLCLHIRWPARLTFLGYGGDLGVRLFFALSGFLITSRLIDEFDTRGVISWRGFYIRRAFRILPPAFLALLVLALLGPVLHVLQIDVRGLIASAFFYRNYLPDGGWYTAHFWSLAVEEHFYLLWPAVLALVGIARGWRASLALAAIFTLWRHADTRFNWVGHLWPFLHGDTHRTDYRIPGLLWGCLVAFLWRSQAIRMSLTKVVRSWWSLPLVVAAVLLVRIQTTWSDDGLDLLMAALPLITIADPRGAVSRVLETRLMRWIGLLSYSLYLWQQLFIPFYANSEALIQRFPINVVASFCAAALSYYLIERPFISLGRRLVRSKREQPVDQTAGARPHAEDHPVPVVQGPG
jgi:peptidoglycan/LPS O-acetylase OafA/YrhL